ncbi:MAG: Gfo/Idh/MocA family oxidoreductase [Chloroflexi bacterium]|nr:Gfo/Idh/MocA family oxidoreductase [Chloroflexota bacterium]
MAETTNPTAPDPQVAKPLRFAIIGVGAGIFKLHRPGLAAIGADIVGVSDVNQEMGRRRAAELGCPFYADSHEMLLQTQPEVVSIITPHPFHAPLAIDSMRAGAHVLVEKPIAIQVAEADKMVETARETGRLLAVNYQMRHRPEIQAIHRLIQEGSLGILQHVDMVATWLRTAAYYKSGGWRGTWSGEGGGVLMNQAPHNLDLLCYFFGLPSRVVGWTRTLLHPLETEDTAQAMLEWPDGLLGSLHISTAEAGQPERLEITGTHGFIQLTKDAFVLNQFERDLREHIIISPGGFDAIGWSPATVELAKGSGDHLAVYRNLQDAIRNGAPLTASGESARMSLELANSMIYSSYKRTEVQLPLDRQKYAALLEDLKANRVLA